MNFDSVAFGKRLRAARKKKKMTQKMLADNVGVGRQYISSIERGEGTPTTPILFSICSILEVSSDELLGGIKLSNYVPSDMSVYFKELDNNQTQTVRVLLQEYYRQNKEKQR